MCIGCAEKCGRYCLHFNNIHYSSTFCEGNAGMKFVKLSRRNSVVVCMDKKSVLGARLHRFTLSTSHQLTFNNFRRFCARQFNPCEGKIIPIPLGSVYYTRGLWSAPAPGGGVVRAEGCTLPSVRFKRHRRRDPRGPGGCPHPAFFVHYSPEF